MTTTIATPLIYCKLTLEQPIGTSGRFRRYTLTDLDSDKQMIVEGLFTDGARWRGDVHAFPFNAPLEAWKYALANAVMP